MVIKLTFSKRSEKYLAKLGQTDLKLFEKITNALQDVTEMKGDIKKMQGVKNQYRYKIYQYRVIFSVDRESDSIFIVEIGTRGNIYK